MNKVTVLLILIIFLIGCTMEKGIDQKDTRFEKVDSLKAKELIDSGIITLDIRTPEEFNEERIAGSVNIDFYASNFEDKLNELDKTKPYLIYCRSGHRSGIAHERMKELGFLQVYDLIGGINEWKKTYSTI